MRKVYVILVSVLLTTLILFGGYFLYNNYSSKGIATTEVVEKIEKDNRFLLEVEFQSDEREKMELHPSAWNLVKIGESYELRWSQKLFDKYKQVNHIDVTK
ncbi:hypothetical protein CEY16_06590 [Halalkalibacillus sediminis]|uniref:Uncharacterized protein n=1 Tax=Halalkalibacillus sediminis TaxID=2018042 RepID=A0A2I0QTD5_9BACI|nr:hypothetical protein [Halalkalibacillus sediminis]PKR77601.1 hypothetical protein CEY16_06590 [Halalkalibacillus sediminis]